jgi:hypothetical protein
MSMSNTDQPWPTADCPTCHTKHSVALEEGMSTTQLCNCGKLLKIERGPGTQLVVIEQITPFTAVKPATG